MGLTYTLWGMQDAHPDLLPCHVGLGIGEVAEAWQRPHKAILGHLHAKALQFHGWRSYAVKMPREYNSIPCYGTITQNVNHALSPTCRHAVIQHKSCSIAGRKERLVEDQR